MSAPSPIGLVIFDCDGVLVDTERLAIRVESEILTAIGWPMTPEEVARRFVGRSAYDMCAEVSAVIGRTVEWEREFELPFRDAVSRELQPVKGIDDVLDSLVMPFCVASNSRAAMIEHSLSTVGLWDRFAGRAFSAHDLGAPKPAPDVFLHAAAVLNVPTSQCVVIEDSVSGVRGALAAGMHVFGYGSSVTDADELKAEGAEMFYEMIELRSLLAR